MSEMGGLACDLTVFSDAERGRYRALSRRIWAACRAKRELDDGVALRFAADADLAKDLDAFAELERRCCPFLTLEVTAATGDGALELRVTGGEGVKAFLAEEGARGEDRGARVPRS
jgi:hypothetical protein